MDRQPTALLRLDQRLQVAASAGGQDGNPHRRFHGLLQLRG
jgi:hypothetical protein